MGRKKTVGVVVAHADDMEFMAAGTVARMIQEKGYAVHEYILTDNSRGSYRLSGKGLIDKSAAEARAAAAMLGLEEVRFEGYSDGYLNEVPPNVLRGQVMAFLREIQADVVMSWDPFAPHEDHPDHRVLSMAVLEAAAFCGNPRFYPEHKAEPYPVTTAYWFAKHPQDAGLLVDISSTVDLKIAALLCHECQMDFTVDALRQEAQVLGLDLAELTGRPDKDLRSVIGGHLRRECAETGRPAGYGYAERFRFERLTVLDMVSHPEAIDPDF